MPRTKTPSARESILSAVEDILDQVPGLSFSLNQVAAKARVSKGGLLYHFPTKEALLEGLVARFVEKFDQAVAHMVDTEKMSYRDAYVAVSLQPDAIKATRTLIAVATVDEGLLNPLRSAYKTWQEKLTRDMGNASHALALRLLLDGYLLSKLGELQAPTRSELLKAIAVIL